MQIALKPSTLSLRVRVWAVWAAVRCGQACGQVGRWVPQNSNCNDLGQGSPGASSPAPPCGSRTAAAAAPAVPGRGGASPILEMSKKNLGDIHPALSTCYTNEGFTFVSKIWGTMSHHSTMLSQGFGTALDGQSLLPP